MFSNIVITSWIMLGLLTGCKDVPEATTYPNDLSELTSIKQIADLIEGQQGDSLIFRLSDYYVSNSPITSVEFYSDNVIIEPMEGDSFKIKQSANLIGEFIIEGNLTNEDDFTLESQLTYMIGPVSKDSSGAIPPVSDEILVIMPLGDSLTNDSRPRVTLWNLLVVDGHKLDFVGDQYQSSSIPDPHHEGVGGIKIQGIIDKSERLIHKHKPKYVLLMVGTNDIAWYFDKTGAEIAHRWNQLVQSIFDNSDPDVYIIAATIPPVTSKMVGRSDMEIQDRAILVGHFNAELRKYISDRRNKGDNIVLADVEAKITIDKHLSGDGVHLNEDGYIIMGTVYYDAVNTALLKQK